jgi:hypothetical protein
MTTQTTQWGGTFSWRKTTRRISQNNDATIMRYFPFSYLNKFDPLGITNYDNDNNKKVNDTIIYDCWNGGTLHSLWAQLMWCLLTHEINVNNLWHIWSCHISFAPMNKLHEFLSWNWLVSSSQVAPFSQTPMVQTKLNCDHVWSHNGFSNENLKKIKIVHFLILYDYCCQWHKHDQ